MLPKQEKGYAPFYLMFNSLVLWIIIVSYYSYIFYVTAKVLSIKWNIVPIFSYFESNKNFSTYLGRIGNKDMREKIPTLCRNTYIVGYGVLNTYYSLPPRESRFNLSLLLSKIIHNGTVKLNESSPQ